MLNYRDLIYTNISIPFSVIFSSWKWTYNTCVCKNDEALSEFYRVFFASSVFVLDLELPSPAILPVPSSI